MARDDFDLRDLKKMAKYFDRLAQRSEILVDNFMDDMGKRITELAASRTPIYKERMIHKWKHGISRQGKRVYLTIENPQPYASFVEYGFNHHGRKMAIARGDTRWETPWIQGKFMLKRSIDDELKHFNSRWEALWGKILKDFTTDPSKMRLPSIPRHFSEPSRGLNLNGKGKSRKTSTLNYGSKKTQVIKRKMRSTNVY